MTTLAQYLGQVATNCLGPNMQNKGATSFMSRSRHIARDDIKQVKIGFPNWVTRSDTNHLEAGMGGVATIIASIEYPIGTFRQLLFSGDMTGRAADYTTLFSDPCDISIPDGATFFVRTWFSNPAGIVWSDGLDTPNGEAFAFSSSGVAEQTRGGTVTSTDANTYPYCYRPVAIVAQTTRPSVLLLGDSRASGVADSYRADTSSARGAIARSLADNIGYINAGVGGDRATFFNNYSARRRELAQFVSHIIVEYGINDLNNGLNAGQVRDALQTLYASLPAGKPIFQATLEPYTSSTDGWTTLAGQSPAGNFGERITLNTALRNGQVSGLAGIIDVADAMESGRNSGKWRVGWPDGPLTLDGLHAAPAGAIFFKNLFHISPDRFQA